MRCFLATAVAALALLAGCTGTDEDRPLVVGPTLWGMTGKDGS